MNVAREDRRRLAALGTGARVDEQGPAGVRAGITGGPIPGRPPAPRPDNRRMTRKRHTGAADTVVQPDHKGVVGGR